MKKAIILFSFLISISACGDKAPRDAIVTGPTDSTLAGKPLGEEELGFFRPLDFVVTNGDGNPLPDIEIEFFQTGSASTVLTDINGIPLSNSNRITSKTDDAGVARISIRGTLPACSGSTAISVTAGVLATVGPANDSFTGTLTRVCS